VAAERERNPLAELEQTTGGREIAQLMDHADGLVPEGQSLAVADCTRHGVSVGGAEMSALVVWLMASLGPGRGIGLSITPTLPIPCITKHFIISDMEGS
jgi:hypothetical protein